MKKTKRRILRIAAALFLTLCLVVGSIPIPFAAAAEEPADMQSTEPEKKTAAVIGGGIITPYFPAGWGQWDAYSACGTPRYNEDGSGGEYAPFRFSMALRPQMTCKAVSVRFTLPEGFSFSGSWMQQWSETFLATVGEDYNISTDDIYPIYLNDAESDKYYYMDVSIKGYACPEEGDSYYFECTAQVPFFHIVKAWNTAEVNNEVLGSFSVPWSLSLMETGYHQNAAELSAVLSQLAYSEEQLYGFLAQLGFDDIVSDGIHTPGVNMDAVGRYFARKTVLVDGERKYMMLAIARGTTGGTEWLGNFHVGSDELHAGFSNAASQMRGNLYSYLNQYCFNPDFVLITGHSKGAAVANLLAHGLQNELWNHTAYTFATPSVTREITTSEVGEPNIYNFVFYYDLIRNAPSMQYYGRYGSTRIFGFDLPAVDQYPELPDLWTDSFGVQHVVWKGYAVNELVNSAMYGVDAGAGTVNNIVSVLKAYFAMKRDGMTMPIISYSLGASHSMSVYLEAVRRNAAGADIGAVNQRTEEAYSFFLGMQPEEPDVVMYEFCCPVNVYVYNKNDELVGSFAGNDITCSDDNLILYHAGQARVVLVPRSEDGKYRFNAVGYDNGTMTHIIMYFTPEGETLYMEENIPVADGQQIPLPAQPTDDYAVYTDSETINEVLSGAGLTEEKPCDGGATCPGRNFTDMPVPTSWMHAGIDFAVANNLFLGTSDTTFSPNASMTRAMLVTVLWRLDGKPEAGTQTAFRDVPEREYYAQPVAWASANGIVMGTSTTTFSPNGKITREQMAAILFRYAQQKGYDTSKRAELSKFPDNGKVSDYAKEALAWANAEGLINGDEQPNGTVLLDPAGNATRAQVAAILMRYVQNIVK